LSCSNSEPGRLNPSLSGEHLEEKVQRLLSDNVIVDGLQASTFTDEYFSKVVDAGITVTSPTIAWKENFGDACKVVAQWGSTIRKNRNKALIATKLEDIKRAKQENKLACFINFQDTRPVEWNLEYLDYFYDAGLRMMQLTYNERNHVGDGCGERTDTGLSNFGLKLIDRMNDLNMVVDTSHVGSKTTDEAIEAAKIIVASHSNAKSLCKNPRNKTDDQIRAIARKDGLVGAVAFPSFVKWTDSKNGVWPSLNDYLDQIEYLVKIAGIDHVGIGLDLTENNEVEEAKLLVTRPDIWGYPGPDDLFHFPAGIDSISNFSNIVAGLLSRGYSEKDVLKIIGGNWMRIYERCLD
jgi:membrane dipeptidase